MMFKALSLCFGLFKYAPIITYEYKQEKGAGLVKKGINEILASIHRWFMTECKLE